MRTDPFGFAQESFDENFDRFGDPHSGGPDYNLYNGLSALAEGLQHLDRRLRDIEALLRRLVR
jgi:hypothetical protein